MIRVPKSYFFFNENLNFKVEPKGHLINTTIQMNELWSANHPDITLAIVIRK